MPSIHEPFQRFMVLTDRIPPQLRRGCFFWSAKTVIINPLSFQHPWFCCYYFLSCSLSHCEWMLLKALFVNLPKTRNLSLLKLISLVILTKVLTNETTLSLCRWRTWGPERASQSMYPHSHSSWLGWCQDWTSNLPDSTAVAVCQALVRASDPSLLLLTIRHFSKSEVNKIWETESWWLNIYTKVWQKSEVNVFFWHRWEVNSPLYWLEG